MKGLQAHHLPQMYNVEFQASPCHLVSQLHRPWIQEIVLSDLCQHNEFPVEDNGVYTYHHEEDVQHEGDGGG